ncbi:MAG: hypothetical protein S0880_31755 [Actinomycetota bacterium]|nr:hypothetical protein [Actinomycetota bacterium]
MSEGDPRDRRARRRRAQEGFDALATELEGLAGIDRAVMFGSRGIRHDGRFFAFVGADGQLVAKIAAPRVAELVASGAGAPVRVGRHPAREWVGVPWEAGAAGRWRALLHEAHAHAS